MKYTAFWFNTHKKSGTKQILAAHDSGDGWVGSGNYADIHEVSGFLVLVNPLSMKPFLVVKDYDQLQEAILAKHGCRIEQTKPENAF